MVGAGGRAMLGDGVMEEIVSQDFMQFVGWFKVGRV